MHRSDYVRAIQRQSDDLPLTEFAGMVKRARMVRDWLLQTRVVVLLTPDARFTGTASIMQTWPGCFLWMRWFPKVEAGLVAECHLAVARVLLENTL